MKKLILITTLSSITFLAACSPEIGSKAWCEDMSEKAKTDWTASEAADFAKNCVFKTNE